MHIERQAYEELGPLKCAERRCGARQAPHEKEEESLKWTTHTRRASGKAEGRHTISVRQQNGGGRLVSSAGVKVKMEENARQGETSGVQIATQRTPFKLQPVHKYFRKHSQPAIHTRRIGGG